MIEWDKKNDGRVILLQYNCKYIKKDKGLFF